MQLVVGYSYWLSIFDTPIITLSMVTRILLSMFRNRRACFYVCTVQYAVEVFFHYNKLMIRIVAGILGDETMHDKYKIGPSVYRNYPLKSLYAASKFSSQIVRKLWVLV